MKVPRATYSLRTSFWVVALTWSAAAPCFSATTMYIAASTGAGALMVIEVETSPSGMPSKSVSMSARESMATPTWPTSPSAPGVVGVHPHLRGQVEGHREAGLAVLEEELEALVRLLGGAEAGVLPDRPGLAAVHVGLDAAGEGVLAGHAEVALVVEVGDVGGRVDGLDGQSGRSLEGLATLATGQRLLQRPRLPGRPHCSSRSRFTPGAFRAFAATAGGKLLSLCHRVQSSVGRRVSM